MARTHPDLPWCRYADDGLVHCRTEQEAQALMAEPSSPLGGVPPGDASDENQNRLLQGREAQRQVPECQIRLSRILLSAPAGLKLPRQRTVLWVQPRCQHRGAESHAGDDTGLEPPTSNADVDWQTSPASSILSSGAGSSTTDATRHRLSIPCSDTSIRRYVAGRCGSSSALQATKSARAAFLKTLLGNNPRLFVHWQFGMVGAFA